MGICSVFIRMSIVPALLIATSPPVVAQDSQVTNVTLEEVVVTAQKRRESSQTIGVSVQAFSGEQLAALGVAQTTDIAALTPGVVISNILGGSVPTISIRGMGVGSASFFANQPNSAAINVDDVYLPSAIMSNFQVFDTERVEVLKGPQGTLYGRNTVAGAVNFFSRRPTFETNGFMRASYASFNTVRLESGFGGPLSDRLAYRVSAAYDFSDGSAKNIHLSPQLGVGPRDTNGTQRVAARTQLLFKPSEATQWLLNVHGGVDRSDPFHYKVLPGQLPGAAGLFNFDATCFEQYAPRYPQCLTGSQDPRQLSTQGQDFVVDSNLEVPSDINASGGSLQVEHDFGSFVLNSITAYDQFTRLYFEDEDAGPVTELHVYFDEDFRSYSQELRLTSQSEKPLQWILGLYGSRLNAEMKRQADYTGVTARLAPIPWNGIVYSNRIRETSFAAFAHSTYQIRDRWRLVAGLRYTRDDKSINVINANIIGNTPLFAPITPANYSIVNFRSNNVTREDAWTNLSGKLGVEWQATEDVLAYASASRGFKSGGFPGSLGVSPARLQPYRPEIADAYEIGVKTSFLGRRGLFNVAAFFTDSKDRLEFATAPDRTFVDFTNAASTEIKGVEAQIAFRFDRDLSLEASAAYIEAQYKDFVDRGSGDVFTGNTLPFAPELTASLQGSKTFRFGVGRILTATTSINYIGEQFFNSANIASASARGYTLWNGRVAYSSEAGGPEFALFGSNLADQSYRAGGNSGVTGNNVYNAGRPRVIGVELNYSW